MPWSECADRAGVSRARRILKDEYALTRAHGRIEVESAVSDVLHDLMRYCELHDITFDDCVAQARDWFHS